MLECGDIINTMHNFHDCPLRVSISSEKHVGATLVYDKPDVIVVPLSRLRSFLLENPTARVLNS